MELYLFIIKHSDNELVCFVFINIRKKRCVNPLGTGDLKFYQSQELSTFGGLFIFLYSLTSVRVFIRMVSDNP